MELDGEYYPISPGQVVYFSAYLWVTPATTTEYGYNGGVIGFDVYGSSGRIGQMNNVNGVGEPDAQNGQYVWTNTYVPFGSGGWIQLSFTTTIPSTQETDNGAFTPETPTDMIPWICLSSSNPTSESATMYVYYTVIEINPTSAPASSISLNPACGLVGASVAISGAGFADSSALTATFAGTQIWTGTSTSSSTFSASFKRARYKGGWHC